jgi:AcrR family transcriptional regulator
MLRAQSEAIGSEVRARTDHEGPAAERLAGVIASLANRVDENRDLLRMMIRELSTAESPVTQEIAGMIRKVQNPIIDLLKDARRRGEIRDVDPRIAGVTLAGMLIFYHLAYPVTSILVGPRNLETLAALQENVARIFLHGVLKAPSSTQEHPS